MNDGGIPEAWANEARTEQENDGKVRQIQRVRKTGEEAGRFGIKGEYGFLRRFDDGVNPQAKGQRDDCVHQKRGIQRMRDAKSEDEEQWNCGGDDGSREADR